MKSRKFLTGFVFTVICSLLTVAAFNAVVNPFGVINTEVLGWHSYNFTQNPRTAKISYLDKNYHKYNAYIVGSSGASGFPTWKLDQYNKKRNYNLFYYGADMLDTLNTVIYITENYEVDEILMPLSFSSALAYNSQNDDLYYSMDCKVDRSSPAAFYSKYLLANPRYAIEKIRSIFRDSYFPKSFDVFIPENGLYDKRLRDVEYLGTVEEYMEKFQEFKQENTQVRHMTFLEEAMDSVKKIKSICDSKGIKLTVVLIPLYEGYLQQFSQEDIELFYRSLNKITGFWDFTYSSVSKDPRYFYDPGHFRNAVGEMMLARIYGDTGIYIPDDFGVYVEQNNLSFGNLNIGKRNSVHPESGICDGEISRKVPILLFHHFEEVAVPGNNSVLSKQKMVEILNYLKKNGYTTITFDDLEEYVCRGAELPEKPIMLTLDDGYMSNYEFLYPLLKEMDMKATIFVIGSLMGADTYKDTGIKIYPHFSVENAEEMVESGVIQIGSHTFDMHQSEELERNSGILKPNMLRPAGMPEEDYIRMVKDDLDKFGELYKNIENRQVTLLAYPYGLYDQELTALLHESGIRGTFTTEPGISTIIKGLPQTLMNLKRISINEDTDIEAVLGSLP